MYAVGGNIEAARLSGINVARTLILVYGITGLAAALGGIIQAGRLGAASPLVGTSIPLDAAAAVLLGGTSFTGGVGGVTGTAVGVLFIGTLQNGLSIAGVSSFWQQVVTGAILIVAVAIDRLQQNPSGRHPASQAGNPARADLDGRSRVTGASRRPRGCATPSRSASDMIPIIGLTPGASGSADASPTHTPLHVVELAPPVSDGRRGIRPHAGAAHLVRRVGHGPPPVHRAQPVEEPIERFLLADSRRRPGGSNVKIERAPAASCSRASSTFATFAVSRSRVSSSSHCTTARPAGPSTTRPLP